MKNKKKSGGYSYTLENEKILEYITLSTEEKLEWLEEINNFTQAVLSGKKKKMINKLRAGEI
jgi:hypothetical protein